MSYQARRWRRSRIELSDEYANVEFTGKDIRNWQNNDGGYVVQLHTPVSGAYTLLATYERPFKAQGETLAFTGARPLDAQSEQGYTLVTSAYQFEVKPAEVSPGLLPLETGEVPPEYRLFFDAPVLAAYRYASRPFNLKLALSPLAQGDSLNQIVDRASLETRISKEGQAVTDIRYFIKNRGNPHFRLTIPGGAQLWSASVNGAAAVPVSDGAASLIPLPQNTDPNAVLELDLKLASPVQRSGTRPRRSARGRRAGDAGGMEAGTGHGPAAGLSGRFGHAGGRRAGRFRLRAIGAVVGGRKMGAIQGASAQGHHAAGAGATGGQQIERGRCRTSRTKRPSGWRWVGFGPACWDWRCGFSDGPCAAARVAFASQVCRLDLAGLGGVANPQRRGDLFLGRAGLPAFARRRAGLAAACGAGRASRRWPPLLVAGALWLSCGAAICRGADAAALPDSVTQTIRVEDKFVLGTAKIHWQAVKGQWLPLLSSKAVLTRATYPADALRTCAGA